MLQNRRDPLKTHASIYARLRQRMHIASLIAIELHENVIPDLNVAIAIFIRTSRGAASNMRAMVVEDFRARTTWARITHHPEVI